MSGGGVNIGRFGKIVTGNHPAKLGTRPHSSVVQKRELKRTPAPTNRGTKRGKWGKSRFPSVRDATGRRFSPSYQRFTSVSDRGPGTRKLVNPKNEGEKEEKRICQVLKDLDEPTAAIVVP